MVSLAVMAQTPQHGASTNSSFTTRSPSKAQHDAQVYASLAAYSNGNGASIPQSSQQQSQPLISQQQQHPMLPHGQSQQNGLNHLSPYRSFNDQHQQQQAPPPHPSFAHDKPQIYTVRATSDITLSSVTNSAYRPSTRACPSMKWKPMVSLACVVAPTAG